MAAVPISGASAERWKNRHRPKKWFFHFWKKNLPSSGHRSSVSDTWLAACFFAGWEGGSNSSETGHFLGTCCRVQYALAPMWKHLHRARDRSRGFCFLGFVFFWNDKVESHSSLKEFTGFSTERARKCVYRLNRRHESDLKTDRKGSPLMVYHTWPYVFGNSPEEPRASIP